MPCAVLPPHSGVEQMELDLSVKGVSPGSVMTEERDSRVKDISKRVAIRLFWGI